MRSLPLDSEFLIFRSDMSSSLKQLDWGHFDKLKMVRICSRTLCNTNQFYIHGLPQLVSLVVEEDSIAGVNQMAIHIRSQCTAFV